MKLFNSMTRQKEEFKSLEDKKVRMYNCGPTVYNFIHVGNARPLVVFDTLRRYFIYKGYDVDFVVNFTDIDDKLINRAKDENTTVFDVADRYIGEFMQDANGLNLYTYKTINPRATEFIEPMLEFVGGLVEKGAAYPADGDVYFDITKAKDYGKLSGKNIDELQSGARIEVNSAKKNPGDFVLWKGKKEGEPFWASPWGDGRPGWHLECSVMAKTLLGETIDIHSGGEDLQFPHHENEIAQSETLTGKTFANYWLHNGMITVDGTKMSKSLGNFFTVREVANVFDLEVLRFFLLSAHYRSPINYSYDAMEQTKAGLDRLYGVRDHMEQLLKGDMEAGNDADFDADVQKEKEEFMAAMDDDLNTARATGALFTLARDINTFIAKGPKKDSLQSAYDTFMELADVLGILYRREEADEDSAIEALLEERKAARANKDFARADAIRDELFEKGIAIEDTREGTLWKRI
ncbi:MAG: cysteine--tRNA ligase [Peptoniphilaceae bacterium]|uniref:cysteine--tRNA ligase n=1 Tax=Aedoeadaptatus acetigenes TaxID=2981723 RepID=UPI0011DC7F9E|nr:cysteine--tRNA ligase [Aedoeadaptatus acetigenes]MBS6525122.1 cysteine--tRNA ligase [Peptoniphilaceae bacterium]MCU6786935.1 cysteine--tRNA ligase [Aedoeadaptatus acetigenes]